MEGNMTWPEAFDHAVVCVCTTFVIWRIGAGLSRHWGDWNK